MSQGDSVIEELWHTGLNALGTLGRYRMSFLILSMWIPSSLQRAAVTSLLRDWGRLEGKRGNQRERGRGRRKKGGRRVGQQGREIYFLTTNKGMDKKRACDKLHWRKIRTKTHPHQGCFCIFLPPLPLPSLLYLLLCLWVSFSMQAVWWQVYERKMPHLHRKLFSVCVIHKCLSLPLSLFPPLSFSFCL